MTERLLSPGLNLFGHLVSLKCDMKDLELVLRKTEEIEFPDHQTVYDEEILISDIFPQITRKSFVVTLLITLEDQFKIYCSILREATSQKLKWSDLKGSAIERFLMYAETVCELGTITSNENKQELKGIIEIRNCIVHNNSSIEGFNRTKIIEQFTTKATGVSIIDGQIVLDTEGCEYCSRIAFQFMEDAYKSALTVFPK